MLSPKYFLCSSSSVSPLTRQELGNYFEVTLASA